MAIDSTKILAAVAAAGTSGAELFWVAPIGSTAPTSATGTLDAAWLSAGLIHEDGIEKAIKTSTSDVMAYGLLTPVRKIVTSEEITITVTFREHNAVSMAVYNKLPLTGAGAPTFVAGETTIDDGIPRTQRYMGLIDMVDGDNRIRALITNFEVTERGGQTLKAGSTIDQQVTLTAYPNSAGVAVRTFYLIDALVA